MNNTRAYIVIISRKGQTINWVKPYFVEQSLHAKSMLMPHRNVKTYPSSFCNAHIQNPIIVENFRLIVREINIQRQPLNPY